MTEKGKTAPPVVKAPVCITCSGLPVSVDNSIPTQKAPALRHPWLRPVAFGAGLAWASMPTLKGRPPRRPIVRSSRRRPTAAAASATSLPLPETSSALTGPEKRFGMARGSGSACQAPRRDQASSQRVGLEQPQRAATRPRHRRGFAPTPQKRSGPMGRSVRFVA